MKHLPIGEHEARMSDLNTFADFIHRIRAGDEQAAAELVRQYEPLIRREVRLQLEDRRLCRLFDSMDVCQSVLASFFVRTAAGQYDLDRPEQLVSLLVTIARNKVVSAARHHRRQRRDNRRTSGALAEAVDDSPSPSELASGKELLQRLRQRFSTEERQLADLRGKGLAWAEIAVRLGGTAQARRMQLNRAVERIGKELGFEEDADE
jgi:RNA polymerase sigma factor (sigma-70 family)